MKSKHRTFTEGLIVAVFCFWCFFWMLQPAIYWAGIMEWVWLGFPAHYAFWLIGMVIVVPVTCFVYVAWINRQEK